MDPEFLLAEWFVGRGRPGRSAALWNSFPNWKRLAFPLLWCADYNQKATFIRCSWNFWI